MIEIFITSKGKVYSFILAKTYNVIDYTDSKIFNRILGLVKKNLKISGSVSNFHNL